VSQGRNAGQETQKTAEITKSARAVSEAVADTARTDVSAMNQPEPSAKLRTAIYAVAVWTITGGVILAWLGITGLQGVMPQANLTRYGFLVLLFLVAVPFGITACDLVWQSMRPGGMRKLLRLNFNQGIPVDQRVLVVVPVLLTKFNHKAMIDRLWSHIERNPDRNICFALLTNFSDAEQRVAHGDKEILDAVMAGMHRLNERLPAGQPRRFFLFHRARRWDSVNRCWSTPQRKVGNITALNEWLLGLDHAPFEYSPARTEVGDVRYVCTVDADNTFSKNAVLRLVETIAHPDNHPLLTADGQRLRSGLALIAPHVVTGKLPAKASLLECWVTGAFRWSESPACSADVLQDLLGEGCFHGKGIYEVRAFHALTYGCFPFNMILSHDILEGAAAGVKVCADASVFERAPSTVAQNASRQHRWMRGDWQNLMWLWHFHSRPQHYERRRRSARSMHPLLVWRLVENVRRNLTPVFLIAALILGWLFAPMPWRATALVFGIWISPVMLQFLAGTARKLIRTGSHPFANMVQPFVFVLSRTVFEISILPFNALMALHAAALSTWRVCITKRNLLEWCPFGTPGSLGRFRAMLTIVPVIFACATFGCAFLPSAPSGVLEAFGGIWLAAPFLIWSSDTWHVATGAPTGSRWSSVASQTISFGEVDGDTPRSSGL
jgi:cyclic beta-1,2-glucan synthetase